MVKYTDEQQKAIDFCIERVRAKHPLTSLSGLGGTGKTTCLREIINNLRNPGVCTFTGKASDVLRRKGIHSETIHSLIYEWDDKKEVFYKLSRVPYSCFVIDEASMVGKYLYEDLCSFGIPILAVGDPGQLEPISSKELNLVRNADIELKEIHRQAADNPIIQLAHKVRNGENWQDFSKDNCRVTKKRPSAKELATYDMVICGFNKTRIAVNQVIREARGFPKNQVVPGDKLICLNNDKDLAAFNGQTFEVLKISGNVATCQFYDKVRDIPMTFSHLNRKNKMEWEEVKKHKGKRYVVDFGYCITAHKAQGDQARKVGYIDQQCDLWCPKRHRYTGITRAEEELTVWV